MNSEEGSENKSEHCFKTSARKALNPILSQVAFQGDTWDLISIEIAMAYNSNDINIPAWELLF